ncbi:MAG: hypothetical protein ACI4ES_10410 [Roseburia sp.]
MRIVLCIITIACVVLHAFAAMTQIKNNENKTNDIWMMIGAFVALVGAILCLLKNDFDWLMALIGFGFIAYAAVQNGRKKHNVHIRHHIVRASIFIILLIGFFFW